MKTIYFTKNDFMQEYYLDDSSVFGRNRIYIDSREEKDAIKELGKFIDKKRKTLVCVKGKFSEKGLSKLNKLVKGTKIKLNLEEISNGS